MQKYFFLCVQGGVYVHTVILHPKIITGGQLQSGSFLLSTCMGTGDLALNFHIYKAMNHQKVRYHNERGLPKQHR